MDLFSLSQIKAAHSPYSISPIPAPKPNTPSPISWTTKVFGIRTVPDLGILTTSIGGVVDAPVVERSWGLLGGATFYGPNFRFVEYMKARNYLGALAIHFGILFGSLLLAIPLVRKIARRYVYQPGEGPTKEEYSRDRIEYRGIATPDVAKPTARAYCRAYYEGSMYACKLSPSGSSCLLIILVTGASLAQGAMSILRDQHELTGGIYTPATLGQKFIDRLQTVGFKYETKFFDN